MTKTKFLLMAVAPAAIIMPIDAHAASEQVTIEGSGIVGTELKADITSLPKDSNYQYEWYFVNASVEEPISSQTSHSYLIPAEAIGKSIIVKVTDDRGKIYESKKIVVKGTLPIEGNDYVNGQLVAKIEGLSSSTDKPTVFTNFQWYVVEDNKAKPIANETKLELVIPPLAADKSIFFEAKTEDGLIYVSPNKKIQKLNLNIEAIEFEGFTGGDFVVPGDTLKVKIPVVTTETNTSQKITLASKQVSFTYQWLYKIGSSYSIIPNATTPSYMIPKDTQESAMKDIVVKVTAKVGDQVVSAIALTPISISDDHIQAIEKQIGTLLTVDSHKRVVYTNDIQSVIAQIENQYQKLTSAAKSQVTNYSILQRAVADMAKVERIAEKIKALDEKTSLQTLQQLKAEYDQLDYLQRSLDTGNSYQQLLKLLLENPDSQKELVKLGEINGLITALLGDVIDPIQQYAPENTNVLAEKIAEIDVKINALLPGYKMVVQNQAILTMAKADLKSAQKFEKLFDKLQGQTSKQKVATAKSIRSAYLKLNLRQQALVEYRLSLLEEAENAEATELDTIAQLIQEVENTDASKETWDKLLANVKTIISLQKSLKSYNDVAKTNEMIQMQKDLKAAEKVISQLEKYNSVFTTETKYNKIQSAFNSALKAYNKLTITQQKYVYNANILDKIPINSETPSETNDDATAGKKFSDDINTAIKDSSNFENYARSVDELVNKYKELSKGVKKYVTNYADLKAAEANVKAVRSFEKKVNDALNEADSNKQYSKMQAVLKAYSKLNAIQQKLAEALYNQINEKIMEHTTGYNDLNEELVDANGYIFSLNAVKDKINKYNALFSTEKKLITNAQDIKQAIHDVKAVESFIKKFQTNLEKNPSAIIKDFRKLTTLQVSLLKGYEVEVNGQLTSLLEEINKMETSEQTANDLVVEMIDLINELQKDGYYVSDIESRLMEIRNKYNSLTAMQQKLVKNYSKLTQAESDVQKVKEVKLLEGDEEAWQKAYNKFSKKLEQLYEVINP
ncbi:hypothetical protein [Lysinibacillus cavernae]|uniref:hypothetical protein n=1 Tax=Lysinibacillus cavernae TaxID=2666135 RepID=UPI0012D87C95|nr:hypothetical protein [Lysinibacillus cavernae]